MVILDATIVNIALPSAQRDLGFDTDARQWVITSYALSFGALLLLGGRLSDLVGRKRVYVAGLVGFAFASALGGAAGSFGVLVTARVLQGVFGALLAPAALSLLTTTFTDPAERNRAFGIFASIAGIGAGMGLLLGGILTEYLSWRWCLYVNLAFAGPAAFGALRLLHGGSHHRAGERPRLDVPGTVTVTIGLFALVYGFSRAETDGWGDAGAIVVLAASVVLLALFTVLQRRVAHPLLPLRVILDRDRGASFLALAVVNLGIFGVTLFLTYYLQQTMGLSPVEAGLAFIPMNLAVFAGIAIATSRLVPRLGAKPTIAAGLTVAALGMAILAQLEIDSGYATGVLPGILCFGLGFGPVVAAGMATATRGVQHRDSGVASAMVNTSQQIGGSLGIALLSTLFGSATAGYLEDHPVPGAELEAAMHGYAATFWWASGLLLAGALVTGLMLRRGVHEHDPDAVPVVAH